MWTCSLSTWSDGTVYYLGRGVSAVPAASVQSIQSLQRGRQAPPPVGSPRQSPGPQRHLIPTADLRTDHSSNVRPFKNDTSRRRRWRQFLPGRGRRTQRRLPGVPACSWRAGWPQRGGSWGLGARCPAGWTDSTAAGTGPGSISPGSAPTAGSEHNDRVVHCTWSLHH